MPSTAPPRYRSHREVLRRLRALQPKEGRVAARTVVTNATAIRAIFRLEDGSPLTDELLFLAALEQLKRQHNTVRLEYVTSRQEIATLLRSAWFLKAVHQTSDDGQFEEIVGKDYGFTVEDLDPTDSLQAEKDVYDRRHEALVAERTAQQKAALDAGMKDLKIPIPEYMFHQRWHKSNSWLWKIADDLGLPIAVPDKAMPPYAPVVSSVLKEVRLKVQQARLLGGKTCIYDYSNEPFSMALISAASVDDVNMLSLAEVQAVIGEGFNELRAFMSLQSICLVVGPVGPMLYAAWSQMNIPTIEIYSGQNPTWDGVHPTEKQLVSRDRFTNEGLPQGIGQALYLLQKRMERKR